MSNFFRSKAQDRQTLEILYNTPPEITKDELKTIQNKSSSFIRFMITRQELRRDVFNKLCESVSDKDINYPIWKANEKRASSTINTLNLILNNRKDDKKEYEEIKKKLQLLKKFKGDKKVVNTLSSLLQDKKYKLANESNSLLKLKQIVSDSSLGHAYSIGKDLIDGSKHTLKIGKQYVKDKEFRKFVNKRTLKNMGKNTINMFTSTLFGDELLEKNSLEEDYKNYLNEKEEARQIEAEYKKASRSTKISTLKNKELTTLKELNNRQIELSSELLVDSDTNLLKGLDKQFKSLSKDIKKNGSSLLGSVGSFMGKHSKIFTTIAASIAALVAGKVLFGTKDAEASTDNIDTAKEIQEQADKNSEVVLSQKDEPLRGSNVVSGARLETLLSDFNPTYTSVSGLTEETAKTRENINRAADERLGDDEKLKAVNAGIVSMESSFKNNASNSRSTATGTHQFLQDTWMGQLKKHGDEYAELMGVDASVLKNIKKTRNGWSTGNLDLDRKLLSKRTDSYISGVVGADFLKDNKADYEREYGKMDESNYEDLYAIHHYGFDTYKYFKDNKDKNVVGTKPFNIIVSSNEWIGKAAYMKGNKFTGQDMIDLVTKKVKVHVQKEEERRLAEKQAEEEKTKLAKVETKKTDEGESWFSGLFGKKKDKKPETQVASKAVKKQEEITDPKIKEAIEREMEYRKIAENVVVSKGRESLHKKDMQFLADNGINMGNVKAPVKANIGIKTPETTDVALNTPSDKLHSYVSPKVQTSNYTPTNQTQIPKQSSGVEDIMLTNNSDGLCIINNGAIV